MQNIKLLALMKSPMLHIYHKANVEKKTLLCYNFLINTLPNSKREMFIMSRKIAIIGGGGKITSAVIFELLNRDKTTDFEFALFGRTASKIHNTIEISNRFNSGNGKVYNAETLENALAGAELVLYCASYGLEPYGEYKAMGVSHGAYIMGIAEKINEICPNAWLLAVTNPPDIPLMAAGMKFGLKKLIGLCNATSFTRKVISSFMGYEESELFPMDIGVNHELWLYDMIYKNESVYDNVRSTLLQSYSPDKVKGDFHESFPEWREGFVNNVAILKETGYLHGPVGGCARFSNLPFTEMGKLMKRPSYEDFEKCLNPELSNDEILRVTRRCAAEFPIYIADIIASALSGDGKKHSILTENCGAVPSLPDDAFIQLTCGITKDEIIRPNPELPEFIKAKLTSRVLQNHILAKALAEQDEKLLKQALLTFPERVPFDKLDEIIASNNTEPYISLN